MMAAIAARSGGRGGRGAGRGVLGGGLAGGLAGGLKRKKKTVSSALEALKQTREKSRIDVDKLPVKLPDFEVVDVAIAKVVEVCARPTPEPSDEISESALEGDMSQEEARSEVLHERRLACEKARDAEISAACKAAVDEIAAALSSAKRGLDGIGRELLEVEDDLERWRKRENEAPNRQASLAKEEDDWAQREARDNGIALSMMRTLVPPDVGAETAESLRLRAAKTVAAAAKKHKEANADKAGTEKEGAVIDEKKEAKKAYQMAAAWGGIYTYELAQRIKTSKLLHWVQAHPEDIATANFLAGAGADSFKNLGDYDIVELRAVYAACPPKFDLDGTGAKAAWRAQLVERLRQLTSRDRGEEISAGWDGANNRRKVTRLPPLEPKHKRHSAYYYPCAAELEARAQKHVDAKKRLEERRLKVEGLEQQLADAKSERDAAFADARSEYLQQRYGKAMLKDLAKEADDSYKRVLSALGNDVSGARADLKRAASAVANASPSEAEQTALRKLLEKYKLDQPNPEADAEDCRRLAKKALEKLGGISEDKEEDLWPLDRCSFVSSDSDQFDPRGRLIRGPFDPWPEIKRAAKSVVKKLTDAEEAEMRKKEVAAAVSSSAESKDGGAAARRKALEAKNKATTQDTRKTASVSASNVLATSSSKELEPVAPKSRRLSMLLRQQEQTKQQRPDGGGESFSDDDNATTPDKKEPSPTGNDDDR